MKTKLKRFCKKFKKHITTVIIVLVFSLISFFIGKRVGLNTDTSSSNTTIEDIQVSKQNITKTITTNGQIEASSTNKLTLNTSYYYNSLLVEEDDVVKKVKRYLNIVMVNI